MTDTEIVLLYRITMLVPDSTYMLHVFLSLLTAMVQVPLPGLFCSQKNLYYSGTSE